MMNLVAKISGLVVANSLFLATAASAQFRLNEPTFFETGNEQFSQELERLQQAPPPPVLTIDAGVQQWQPITSSAGGFSVWVPLGVLSDAAETVTIGTTTIDFRVLSSQVSTGKFVVAYADAPALDASTLLTEMTAALGARTGFAVDQVEPLALDEGMGIAVTLRRGDELISAEVIISGDRLYVVGVRHADQSDAVNMASRFLASFQITPDA